MFMYAIVQGIGLQVRYGFSCGKQSVWMGVLVSLPAPIVDKETHLVIHDTSF